MGLTNLKEILADARAGRYAVPAFDVSNDDMIRAVVEVCRDLRAPVILSALEPDVRGTKIEYFTAMARVAAGTVDVPVCIHRDHATDVNEIRRCIEHGFTSVMYDGSAMPFDANVRATVEVCALAHPRGITVEAELGHMADAMVGNGLPESEAGDEAGTLTEPEEVERFVEATGVDALAVAVGTAHGLYREEPKVDIARLARINALSTVPLVLHGGSGTPEAALREAIRNGVCKINVFSDILKAFFGSLRDVVAGLDNLATWPSVAYAKPIAAMKEEIAAKVRLFGAAGRA
jgi:ketose-bisphosphate aldolase